MIFDLGLVICGLVSLILGADFLVKGVVSLSLWMALSALIRPLAVDNGALLRRDGPVMLAVSELFAAVALWRQIGSAAGVIFVVILMGYLAIPDVMLRFDLWIMLAVSLFAVFLLRTDMRLDRWEGGALLAIYVVYIAAQFDLEPLTDMALQTAHSS